jgi:hypothetical protein
MKKADRQLIQDGAKKIYDIVEAAEAGLSETERTARWARFMRSTDAVVERHERSRQPAKAPACGGGAP